MVTEKEGVKAEIGEKKAKGEEVVELVVAAGKRYMVHGFGYTRYTSFPLHLPYSIYLQAGCG